MTPDPAAALAAAAEVGPFCALDDAPGPGWLDLAEGPAVLAARSRAVVGVLGPAAEPRVVASLVHLGVVARLLSPALGAALAGAVLPVPTTVALRPTGANPVPMAWSGVRGVAVPTSEDIADAVAEHWLEPWVAPWTDLLAGTGLSRQVLTGNVVSALHGTTVIAAAARPELADRARDVVDLLASVGPLAGAGARRRDGSFVRSSCCLFYRLPGGGTCADCVLDPRTG